MKLIYKSIGLILIWSSLLHGECDECKKLREELTKSWKLSIELIKETKSLTDSLLKHSETIRKMNGTL